MHLKTIHFVGVILGELYLAAEFVDGTVRHYWLQNPATWQPNHVYLLGELVQPSTPNGYYYQAPAGAEVPAWAPGTVYAVGDTIQPATPNGWTYTVVEVTGTSPTSGSEEPTWPTSAGAEVFEGIEQSVTPANSPLPGGSAGGGGIGSGIRNRYNLNPSGQV